MRSIYDGIGVKKAFCYGLAVVTTWLSTAAFAQDVFSDVWTVLNLRRTPPIHLDEFGYGDTFSSVRLLKLTGDSVVLTVEGLHPKKPLFLLGVLCDAQGETWVSDASLLRPDEPAEEFVDANLRFGLPWADNVRFALCMDDGMAMDQERRTTDVVVFRSEDRVIGHLNRWAWFLAGYRDDAERAGEFLTRSLSMQTDALNAVISSPKINELHFQLSYFDQTEPLAVLEAGVAPPQVEASILRRYLEVTTRARRKLLAFYPEHRERLEGEHAMLKGLEKSASDD